MNLFKTVGIWLVIAVVVFILGVQLVKQPRAVEIPIVQFLELAEKYHDPAKEANPAFEGDVIDRSGKISGKLAATVKELNTTGQPKEFRTSYVAGQSDEVLAAMRQFKVRSYTGREASGLGTQILISLLMPIILIVAIWFIFMRQIQSSGNKAMSFGKSRAKLVQEGQTKVTFDDVAGVDEAKEELREIVDFLKEPKKFTGLGARIPKGVLLYGPPGTGKTLLAKAVAGEANVPFFSISGSDFVEMFVGVGASRVRDLFEQAKKNKPCLVFIDEIDAVGRHRFAGIGGGHDEREQTLNQLLVEMDGFQTNEGVILMAATNRSDVLDPALLRPGRFDRQVAVDYPDILGREKILKVHSKGVKLGPEIDLKAIARSTPGFSGADLANIINEAALLAARRNRKQIGQPELDEARDRVSMGPERRSLVISDDEKRATAIHEAGHALAAYFTDGADPVRKITIIPRGRSLGVTQIIPDRDPHSRWKKQLKARLVVGLGGMAAELEVFKESGTGVGNDLYHVASIARKMVTAFGMSDRVGPRALTDENSELFVGREMGGGRDRGYSEELARIVDEEVKLLVDEASAAARGIMSTQRDKLDALTQALLERETIMGEEFRMLMEGKPLPPLFNNRDDAGAPPAAPPTEEKKKVPPRLADILDGGPAPQPS